MGRVEFKVDIEPQGNYEKAKKLLFETDAAIELLTLHEQQKLAREFLQFKGMYGLYQIMQQQLG